MVQRNDEMMNAFNIKYLNNVTSIFDKKYAFITIEVEKRAMLNQRAMAGVFVQLPLYAFTPICKDI